jgi:excinuclease UvrABC helicase subunit UvrB
MSATGSTEGGEPLPAAGRARDLTRARRPRPQAADTGRRHHIGDAPAVMTVLRADGTVGTTRTAPIQLRDKTVEQVERLAAVIETEMTDAASSLDFETAAHLRDELQAAREELARRGAPGA